MANKERFVNYQKYRKIVLTVSVVGNLGILCFFKYTEFLLTSLRDLTGTDIHIWKLALPIGISFYTFQTMSYTIDVYRQKVKAQHNLIAFGMYVSMFPQLIAGPIVRYASVEQQMNDRVLVPAKNGSRSAAFYYRTGQKGFACKSNRCIVDRNIDAEDRDGIRGMAWGHCVYVSNIF